MGTSPKIRHDTFDSDIVYDISGAQELSFKMTDIIVSSLQRAAGRRDYLKNDFHPTRCSKSAPLQRSSTELVNAAADAW